MKRHGYYCRSRGIAKTSRTRSCILCARGKTRCDNEQPDCSKCLSKGVRCQYLADTARFARPTQQHNDGGRTPKWTRVPSIVAEQPNDSEDRGISNEVDVFFNAAFDSLDSCSTVFGRGRFDPDIDLASLWNPHTTKDDASFTSLESRMPTTPLIPQAKPQHKDQQPLYAQDISIPPIPSTTVRSFHRRPKLNSNANRITTLILANLKSYPLMMLRSNTLPPFIHPYLTSANPLIKDMEPLTNCITLVQLLSNQFHSSQKLFWRNVRTECERICSDHLLLNKWQLFAAMQALSIYILIRLDVGETEHNDFDGLLVTAVIVAATQFNSVYTDGLSAERWLTRDGSGLEMRWKEWMLVESARRLCVVYQVVNMLVYFEPAAMCEVHGTELVLAPLPARRPLWEAADEVAWKGECGRESVAYGLAADGDLVRLDGGRVDCGEQSILGSEQALVSTVKGKKVGWEEWCADMDGLGGLVMLAASLVAA